MPSTTFPTANDALAYVRSFSVMHVAYGRYANRDRSFEIEHDALDFSDVTWRVREIECPEDRAFFAKHGHKAWVKRGLKGGY